MPPKKTKSHGCPHCKRSLAAVESLQNHCRASHPAHKGKLVSSPSPIKRVATSIATKPSSWKVLFKICDDVHWTEVEKPANDWTCAACKDEFPTISELQEHKRARRHCYCRECDVTFSTEATETHHFQSFHHTYHCCECGTDFSCAEVLDKHPCKAKQTKVAYPDEDEKLNVLQCVASVNCKRTFDSPSDLLQHIENGTSISSINRQVINKFVQLNDTERLITGNLLGPTSSSSSTTSIMLCQERRLAVCYGYVAWAWARGFSQLAAFWR